MCEGDRVADVVAVCLCVWGVSSVLVLGLHHPRGDYDRVHCNDHVSLSHIKSRSAGTGERVVTQTPPRPVFIHGWTSSNHSVDRDREVTTDLKDGRLRDSVK